MKINEIIRKVGKSSWRLYSHSGKNLGTYSSRAGAEKREREVQYFKHRDSVTEGGWASALTQDTKVTPQLVAEVMKRLEVFVTSLNQYLEAQGLPATEISGPGGSATYYQRDLAQRPDAEYGDIDVQFHVHRIAGQSDSASEATYKTAIQKFLANNQNFSTDNGVNIILKVKEGHAQVDLIYSFMDARDWVRALAPEYKVKGVLCNSLYSSLGQALSISFGGGRGVQVKTREGDIVPFSTQKGVEVQTITLDPHNWARDIAKFFGARKASATLKSYPGLRDEVRVSDIVNSIRGIAETLEANGVLPESYASAQALLDRVREIYLDKINKAIQSSKFEKAASPEAQARAAKTKKLLADKSQEIANLF